MYIDQDLGSIARFIIDATECETAYYTELPEQFRTPSIYFPPPYASANGDTFRTYALKFTWNVQFFHTTTEDAVHMANLAADAIMRVRRVIPILDEAGNKTEDSLRLDDPSTSKAFVLASQLILRWTSRRPYNRNSGNLARRFIYHFDGKANKEGLLYGSAESGNRC